MCHNTLVEIYSKALNMAISAFLTQCADLICKGYAFVVISCCTVLLYQPPPFLVHPPLFVNPVNHPKEKRTGRKFSGPRCN